MLCKYLFTWFSLNEIRCGKINTVLLCHAMENDEVILFVSCAFKLGSTSIPKSHSLGIG